MERTHWLESVSNIGWLCGRCQSGQIKRVDENWGEAATASTIEGQKEEFWEDEWSTFRISGHLRCDNLECAEVYSIAGNASYEYNQVDWDKYEITPSYVISSIFPPPHPFKIADSVPEAVKECMVAAAGLIWSDHDAAGNKIRQAVERLLDDEGVKKFPKTGQRIPIHLHQRILAFAKTNKNTADALLAVKWIGNAASHQGGLTRDQILDAFDIMELVFEDLYIKQRANVLKMISAINVTKKPKAKKKS